MRSLAVSARKDEIAVVGAGIVGLATALAIARTGRSVRLIDREGPAEGCSRGNAGIIATSEIAPLATPAMLLRLPGMLLHPLGPLAIDARRLPSLVPWFVRAAFAVGGAARRQSIARALAALCANALPAHLRLLPDAVHSGLIRREGMLDVVLRRSDLPLLKSRRMLCEAHGIDVTMLTADQVASQEPTLRPVAGGLFHRNVSHVSDPYDVGLAYARAVVEAGGAIERAYVRTIQPGHDSAAVITDNRRIEAAAVIVAAGLGSRPLLSPFIRSIPLAAERGYHIQYGAGVPLLRQPIMFVRESFVATPLAGGLRLAGTAEFASASARPNWRRADALAVMAQRYLPDFDSDGTQWIGARPTFPDSLPALGRIHGTSIYYAFGHQHLGLTLAAITGEIIADLLQERRPCVDCRPFALDRF